jgi:ABC-type uncharacterized transport system permease subunit
MLRDIMVTQQENAMIIGSANSFNSWILLSVFFIFMKNVQKSFLKPVLHICSVLDVTIDCEYAEPIVSYYSLSLA